MPGFTYVVVDKRGKEKRGSIEADNKEKVIDILKNDGLIPVSVKEQGALNKEIDFSIGKKVKPRDLSVFCRQFVSITQAGENSGSLEMAFTRMAVQFEKEAKLKATIRKATIYPIILVVAAIGVVAVMLLFVIPIFIDMFADLDVEMPGITMWVMNTSEWMTEHWYMILGLIILVIVAYKMIYRTEQGRLAIDRVKMKMPLFGKLTVKTACAQFARTMSTLLSSGISTIDALETVSKIVNNIHYTNALLKAREEVMKGIPLSEPLTASKIFPPMVCHMTGIGEETGNIEDMLEKLADYYDEEVEMTTQSVLAAMEPLIIVFMAVVVGTLVVAVVSPIGAMYSGLDNL